MGNCRVKRLAFCLFILAWCHGSEPMLGQEINAAKEAHVSEAASDDRAEEEVSTRWNLPIRTTGGTQFWTDHLHRGGDRLQQHSITGHWRLLDERDIRRAWGTRRHCESVLNQRNPKVASTGNSKHVIVMLHGLMRTRYSMKELATKFGEDGYPDTIRFSYASSRSSIGDHAAALREVLQDYPADTTFSFVGHSMGNIVVRHLIGDLKKDGDPQKLLDRCRSMVMLGPPNQGAAIARRLAPTGLYGIVTGKGGLELGPQWDSFVEKLEIPPFPFAIIAGDVSENRIQNPLIDGSSDFVVTVEEADLEGREWLKTVPVIHSFLMNDETAMQLTVDFIKSNDQH